MRREFGWALDELRAGARVQRAHWNPKDKFLVLMPGYPDGVQVSPTTAEVLSVPVGSVKKFQPYLLLQSGDGSFVPYAPNTADCLAEDWQNYSVAVPAEAPAEVAAPAVKS